MVRISGRQQAIDQSHRGVRNLRIELVHDRGRVVIQAALTNIASHTDDLHGTFVKVRTEPGADQEALSYRVLFRPELHSQGFIK